jgi:hypothetical protein
MEIGQYLARLQSRQLSERMRTAEFASGISLTPVLHGAASARDQLGEFAIDFPMPRRTKNRKDPSNTASLESCFPLRRGWRSHGGSCKSAVHADLNWVRAPQALARVVSRRDLG